MDGSFMEDAMWGMFVIGVAVGLVAAAVIIYGIPYLYHHLQWVH